MLPRVAPSDLGVRVSWHNMFLLYLNQEVLICIHSVSTLRGHLCTFRPLPSRLLLSSFRGVAPSASGMMEKSVYYTVLPKANLTSARCGARRGGQSPSPSSCWAPSPRERGPGYLGHLFPPRVTGPGHHKTPSL